MSFALLLRFSDLKEGMYTKYLMPCGRRIGNRLKLKGKIMTQEKEAMIGKKAVFKGGRYQSRCDGWEGVITCTWGSHERRGVGIRFFADNRVRFAHEGEYDIID